MMSKKNQTRNLLLLLAFIMLAALLLSGCLNMTPRQGVPREVKITISSTKNCSDANCTCVVEARRPRYKWWGCEGGFSAMGGIEARIYNSTHDEYCEDIRVNGMPSRACLEYESMSYFYEIRADCTWCCGDRTFTSCSDKCDWHNCQGICEEHGSWTCSCNPHGDKWTNTYDCPLLTKDNPKCVCLSNHSWTVPNSCNWWTGECTTYLEGEVPCFGQGPGGTGCEVLTPFLDLTRDCACGLLCVDSAQVRYKCYGEDEEDVALFMDCDFHYESSFQGGALQIIQPCNASAMQSIVKDPLREIPFFMVGQGATLDAFYKAREFCKPNYTYTSTVSLGDSVFHPPYIEMTNGSTICWDSPDIPHDLLFDGWQVLNDTLSLCFDNLTLSPSAPGPELHTMEDMETSEFSSITVDTEGHLYLTDTGFNPRFLIYPEGRTLEIHNIASGDRAINRWDNQWGAGDPVTYSIPPFNSVVIPPLSIGPHLFALDENNFSATVFILSTERNVSVSDSGMSPATIAMRQGQQVCFTCETAQGHVLEMYKMLNTSEIVFLENRTLGGQKICCWRPEPNAYYIKDSAAGPPPGAGIFVYVTDKKTVYEVELHNYNFKPEFLMLRNGTEVCFFNPSADFRTLEIDPDPGFTIDVPPGLKTCGYTPRLDMQTITDTIIGSKMRIMVYDNLTTFVNISSIGAQPQFPQTSPGGRVCFVNSDNIPHSVTFSQGASCGIIGLPDRTEDIQPLGISCFDTPLEGAYFFNESSVRSAETGDVTTQSNITALCNPLNKYTFYILNEPPANGSIQPHSLFILSNDTVHWRNCRSEAYDLYLSKNISSGQAPLPMQIPALGSIDWEGTPDNLLIGTATIAASSASNPNQFNLTARLFISDKEAFSLKTDYIYTGSSTRNNLSTHLAVKWLPGDIGDYTLWLARKILGSRALTAFPVGLSNRVLIGIHPMAAYTTNALSIPTGSNITWVNVDNRSHRVNRSWIGGYFDLPRYPDGNITYNHVDPYVPSNPSTYVPEPGGIPLGTYNVSEEGTGVVYSVVASDMDVDIPISMSYYSPAPLNTNVSTSVCFRNAGGINKTLRITPPLLSTTTLLSGQAMTPEEGSYRVYVENSGAGTRVLAHRLEVIRRAPKDIYLEENYLKIACDYSASPGGYSLFPPNATYPVRFGTITDPLNISYSAVIDGVSPYCVPEYENVFVDPDWIYTGVAFCGASSCLGECVPATPSCPACDAVDGGCRVTCSDPLVDECYQCSAPNLACQQRNLYIDSVSMPFHTYLPYEEFEWAPLAGSHLFETESTNKNTSNVSLRMYFGNQINFESNPLPYEEVWLGEGDDISWTNLGIFSGDRVIVERYLDTVTFNITPGSVYCYTPTEPGTYRVDDISVAPFNQPPLGSMNIIAGSDPDPTNPSDYIYLMNGTAGASPVISTTPLSTVCWTSSDGKPYRLETMQGIRNLPPQYCWNPPMGTYLINETYTGLSWLVISQAGEFILPMFYYSNIFDPPSAIIRPNTEVCFRNNDAKDHKITMCKYLGTSGVCVEDCSSTGGFPSFGFMSNYIGTGYEVPSTPWSHTYTITMNVPPPALTDATITQVSSTESGHVESVSINGFNIPIVEIIPDGSSFWHRYTSVGDISWALVVGDNDIVITVTTGDAGEDEDYCPYWLNIAGSRNYPSSWSTILGPGETECMNPQGVSYPAGVCFDPRPLYNFSDNVTGDKITVNVTAVGICDEKIVSNIARKLNRYDAEVFKQDVFDIVAKFNEHGPAWPSIVTSEVGQTDPDCTCAQLINITLECPNCTTALAVEYTGGAAEIAFVDDVLGSCKNSVDMVAFFVDGNSLVASLDPAPCTEFPECNCNYSNVWQSISDLGAYALHEYGKPSAILSFRMADEPAPSCWDNATIAKMYSDFYKNQITGLTGSGIFGLSQACFEENELSGDCFTNFQPPGMGFIIDSGIPRQPQFDSWFVSCGKYYYNSEGITMTTFSSNETNATVCDSSRIMDLYKDYKCYAD